jgi:hypothetical protein
MRKEDLHRGFRRVLHNRLLWAEHVDLQSFYDGVAKVTLM